MKNIVVEKSTGLIKYYNSDFILFNNSIIVSKDSHVDSIITDLNASNSNIYQVEDIDDFIGDKYMYIDDSICLNPDFEE